MKKDRVSIRLSEDLQKFEVFGFKSMTDYIKGALVAYNESKAFDVIKANQIIDGLSHLISIMEAERDNSENYSYPKPKENLIAECYQAAKLLASAEMVRNSPINNIPYPEELKDGEEHPEKFYKHTWAL